MDKPGFTLKNANIALIGLGLMGGSLALSLKQRCRRLSAYDPHHPRSSLPAVKRSFTWLTATPPKSWPTPTSLF